jgi:hypothetical protein
MVGVDEAAGFDPETARMQVQHSCYLPEFSFSPVLLKRFM